jgi:hypothetical protein
MRKAFVPFLGMTLALFVATCGESAQGGNSGNAKVTIARQTFDVKNVELTYEFGDEGYFRIDGEDAAHPDQDCLEGLSGGLALYGDIPLEGDLARRPGGSGAALRVLG